MYITNFQALHYRNMEEVNIQFEPGVNLLWGDNAQGKTNLLEGIYTFARGKSFRGASDSELIRFGENGYTISMRVETKKRPLTFSYRYMNGVRQKMVGGSPVTRTSDMLGHFRAVLFCPDHLQLVKGGPAERRQFLNIAISQLVPKYLYALSRHEKLIRNRNAILKEAQKTGRYDLALLEAYSYKLADECANIAELRRMYVKNLHEYASVFMNELSCGREKLEVRYQSDTPSGRREDYVRRLFDSIHREIAAGCTLYGIQRDDIELLINDKDARIYASQGQMRSIVLALKLAEGMKAEGTSGDSPVFLLDDVLSELDEGRRAYLLNGISDKQIIITSCEKRGFEKLAANEIHVKEGVYA